MAKQNPKDNVRNSSLPLFISRRGVGELLKHNSFRGNDGEPVITETQKQQAQEANRKPRKRIQTIQKMVTNRYPAPVTLKKAPWDE